MFKKYSIIGKLVNKDMLAFYQYRQSDWCDMPEDG